MLLHYLKLMKDNPSKQIFNLQQNVKHINKTQEKSSVLRWDTCIHDLHKAFKLTEHFERVPTPKKIKVSLYDSQKVTAAAMLRLEDKGEMSFYNFNEEIGIQLNSHFPTSLPKVVVKSNIGVLSNPLGSGKTLIILLIIALKPIPTPHTTTVRLGKYWQYKNVPLFDRRGFACPIINVIKRVPKILKPALIISGKPALKQWMFAISTQTTLKAFMIEKVHDLKKFHGLLESGDINNYDIILVKSGKVGGHVHLPSFFLPSIREPINGSINSELYNVICNMTRNRCWSRVIIDDFDQINFPYIFGQMNALFTWYVSSTRDGYIPGGGRSHRKYSPVKYFKCINMDAKSSAESHYTNSYMSYRELIQNELLFTNFNICCTAEFITKSAAIGNPIFYQYVIVNPEAKIIAALNAIGGQLTSDIIEMLNGDALEEAARRAGINSTSVKDIFQKILDTKYCSWEKARFVLKFIAHETSLPRIMARLPIKSNPDKTDTYGKTDLRNARPIDYKYPSIDKIIEEEKDHWKEIKLINGRAIKRVQTNLKQPVCSVCSCNLSTNKLDDEDDDMIMFMEDIFGEESIEEEKGNKSLIMMKCCEIILCATCGVTGANFVDTTWHNNRRLTKRVPVGQCVNCKKDVLFSDLIYINKDFDHEQIIQENTDYNINDGQSNIDIEQSELETKEEKDDKDKTRDKFDILIDIINGKSPREKKHINKTIDSIIKGSGELPQAPKTKVLIYASYRETLKKVEQRLIQKNIHYCRLHGTANQLNKDCIKYNDTDELNVLLASSMDYCAGRDLESTTDLIFVHQLEKYSESQAIGRAQRINRRYKLNVHYILYENEL